MMELLPRDPVGWAGYGLIALGLAVLALSVPVLLFAGWRRARLSERYSPLTGRKARTWAGVAVFCLISGAFTTWFATALERYDPVKPGEPVGLMETREGRVYYTSAFDGRETGLGRALSIEMEKTVRCFDDPTTQRAMAAYADILKERIEVPEEKRATLPEIFEMVQSDAFVQHIEG